jgi:hypothetical protein
VILTCARSRAEPPAPQPSTSPQSVPQSVAQAARQAKIERSLSDMIQQIVADSLPRQFTDDRQWGKTTKVINGLKIEHDGVGIKIRKHTHEVNDGLWKQYRAELVDPDKQLQIRVANLHATGPNLTSLQLLLSARLRGQARVEQWTDGVKLFTITADADCKIDARLDMDVHTSWKPGELLPEMSVEPKITAADLTLADFELQKISKIEGWTARRLGDELKPLIAKQLHSQEPKIVDRLNAAIQKHQGQFHISPDAAVSGTLSKLESFLNIDDSPKPAGH